MDDDLLVPYESFILLFKNRKEKITVYVVTINGEVEGVFRNKESAQICALENLSYSPLSTIRIDPCEIK